jgi:hypothetical protein
MIGDRLVVDPTVDDELDAWRMYVAELEVAWESTGDACGGVLSARYFDASAAGRAVPALTAGVTDCDIECALIGPWRVARRWLTAECVRWIEESLAVRRLTRSQFGPAWRDELDHVTADADERAERERLATLPDGIELPTDVATLQAMVRTAVVRVRELCADVPAEPEPAGRAEPAPVHDWGAVRAGALQVRSVTPKMAGRLVDALRRGLAGEDAVRFAVGTLKGRRAAELLQVAA